MVKTKSSTSGSTEEALPQWAEDEIKSLQFELPIIVKRTGYVLDIYEKDFKLDIQLYDPLPDGRIIIEGLSIPRGLDVNKFMKGIVYEFKIKVFKGLLSANLSELLKVKFSLEMDAIYQFELDEFQTIDIESDLTSQSPLNQEEKNDED